VGQVVALEHQEVVEVQELQVLQVHQDLVELLVLQVTPLLLRKLSV
jgi:hypothetical protein